MTEDVPYLEQVMEDIRSNITYDGIHSVLYGKYILSHINRTKSRYIEKVSTVSLNNIK